MRNAAVKARVINDALNECTESRSGAGGTAARVFTWASAWTSYAETGSWRRAFYWAGAPEWSAVPASSLETGQRDVRAKLQTNVAPAAAHKDERAHTFVGGGVAVGVFDYQVIQVGRHIFRVDELAPVIHRHWEQALYYLETTQEERIGVIPQLHEEARLNPATNSQPNYGVACSGIRRWLGLAHLGLTFGVLEDGHWVRVGNRMTHDSWTKHPG